MTTPVDTKIMKALAHPLRQQILTALNERVASPSELAEELGEPLGNVSYHVRMLVDLDCIELVSTTPRRGALEHHYRATRRAMLDDRQWAALPTAAKRALVGDTLKDIWQNVGAGADAGSFDDERMHVSRERLRLDDQGFDEMASLLLETLERAQQISADSIDRIARDGDGDGDGTVDTWLAMMHFRAAPPASGGKGAKKRIAGSGRSVSRR